MSPHLFHEISLICTTCLYICYAELTVAYVSCLPATDVHAVFAVSLETVLAGHENWVYGLHWQPPSFKGTLINTLKAVLRICWSLSRWSLMKPVFRTIKKFHTFFFFKETGNRFPLEFASAKQGITFSLKITYKSLQTVLSIILFLQPVEINGLTGMSCWDTGPRLSSYRRIKSDLKVGVCSFHHNSQYLSMPSLS